MTATPVPSGQLGLFDTIAPPDPDRPAPAEDVAIWRKAGGSPARAVDVMQDIRDGWFGVLDNTDRVVKFEENERIRHAPDEDVIAALMQQGYVTELGNRERVSCYHGAILRPVTRLGLTTRGKRLLLRWSCLVPLPDTK